MTGNMKTLIKRKVRMPVFLALFLVLRPFGRVSVKLNGIRAWFRFRSVDELIRVWGFTGEKAVFARVLDSVQPGDTVWDIGANIGTHAVMFARKVGDTGAVIAFEPEDGTRRTLEDNVTLNRLSNVQILRAALGSTTGKQTLYVDNRAGSGKHSLVPVDGYEKTEIDVQTGDDLAMSRPEVAPSVLKIDVEGFELEVLKGLEQTLSRDRCRLVMCEVHSKVLRENGHDPQSVRRMLQDAGFSSFDETVRGDELHLLATRD